MLRRVVIHHLMVQPDSENPAILYVDDHPLMTKAVSRLLTDVDCHTTNDPTEVLSLVESLGDRLNVIILDGNIEENHHGIDVLERLDEAGVLTRRDEILSEGQLERGKLIAVLFSSGLTDDRLRERTEAALTDGRFSASLQKSLGDTDAFKEFVEWLTNDPRTALQWSHSYPTVIQPLE